MSPLTFAFSDKHRQDRRASLKKKALELLEQDRQAVYIKDIAKHAHVDAYGVFTAAELIAQDEATPPPKLRYSESSKQILRLAALSWDKLAGPILDEEEVEEDYINEIKKKELQPIHTNQINLIYKEQQALNQARGCRKLY